MQASTNQDDDFGLDSISFRGIFLWNTLEDSIKREKTLACFQKRIGKWSGARCTCKYAINPPYLHVYGYIFNACIILFFGSNSQINAFIYFA